MSREKIYLAYFKESSNRLYYNQLKELTGLSYSSLQNVLKKMILNGELVEEKERAHTFYYLTKKYMSIEFTKITIDLIENLSMNVKVPLNEFISRIPKSIHSVVLFGSASMCREKKNSDIDLLVILESFDSEDFRKYYTKLLKDKINSIVREIVTLHNFSIVYVERTVFDKQEDFLLKEAKNTGYAIVNQQKYYDLHS